MGGTILGTLVPHAGWLWLIPVMAVLATAVWLLGRTDLGNDARQHFSGRTIHVSIGSSASALAVNLNQGRLLLWTPAGTEQHSLAAISRFRPRGVSADWLPSDGKAVFGNWPSSNQVLLDLAITGRPETFTVQLFHAGEHANPLLRIAAWARALNWIRRLGRAGSEGSGPAWGIDGAETPHMAVDRRIQG